MNCANCNSDRILNISAKCSDLCTISMWQQDHDGYVPSDMGIGGGDYVELELCLDCGYANGQWPLPESKLERKFKIKLDRENRVQPKLQKSTPQRNPLHAEYLDRVVKTALNNPYGGMHQVTAIMFESDDPDPDMIIAAIVELFHHAELRNMAESIVELFKPYYPEPGWEHWSKLKQAISPYLEEDEDEEDEDDF